MADPTETLLPVLAPLSAPTLSRVPAALPAPAPTVFPGAGPSLSTIPARQVLEGAFGEATLNGVVVALLYDWKIKTQTRKADFTAAGDKYGVFVPYDVVWMVEATGYVDSVGTVTYLSASLQLSTIPILTFRGYKHAATDATRLIWEGTCFLDQGEISVPMELAVQKMSLQGTGAPTAGVPA